MRNFLRPSALILSLLVSMNFAQAKLVMQIPAQELNASEFPLFDDDLNYKNMMQAIERQRDAFKRFGLKGDFKLGNETIPLKKLADTLDDFEDLVIEAKLCEKTAPNKQVCIFDLNRKIKDNFRLFRPTTNKEEDPEDDNFALFTAYYSPIIKATKQKTPLNQYAIYKLPPQHLRSKTRVQIDLDRELEGHNLELFWTSDPFELYILHIEGGGIVEVQEGNKKKFHFISYDDTNKQPFRFISKYMRSQGMIRNSSVSAQRTYLQSHPEKWREVYGYCPSYIFFKESNSEPHGLEDIPLSNGRSLAQDKSIYKRKGLLTFVQTRRPTKKPDGSVGLKPFSRFFIDQDTGGAIQGEARADLYFGYGAEAEFTAHHLKEHGKIFFLISKN